jgi:sugar fermentation stimulation protein A
MRFPPLIEAILVRRYKRFLADVVLPSGETVTVHVANPGAMTGLAAPGARILLSRSANATRKLPLSWELVEVDFGAGPELVGVNTAHPNLLAAEAIRSGVIPELAGYTSARREVAYGRGSRVDLVLDEPGRAPCYVEVKNVHLMRRPGLAEFPDCVTARGARHLDELAAVVLLGARAVMLFVIQVGSARQFALADDIDPAYAAAFDRARAAGVEAIARRCVVAANEITVGAAVPSICRNSAAPAESLRRAVV